MPVDLALRYQRLEAAFRKLDNVSDPNRLVHLDSGVADLCRVVTEGSGKFPKKYEDEVARSKRGARRNVRAQAVTTLTANIFTRLTDREPTLVVKAYLDDRTPTNPFFLLLSEIFQILGLQDNPEHHAKEYIERVRKMRHHELMMVFLFLLMPEWTEWTYVQAFLFGNASNAKIVDSHPLAQAWSSSNQ